MGRIRAGTVTGHYDDFFDLDGHLGTRVGEEAARDAWDVATGTDAIAAAAAPLTWATDFRAGIPRSGVPALFGHGTADRILPVEATHTAGVNAILPDFLDG